MRPSLFRPSFVPLATLLAICALAGDAHAQSSGSIVVGATILAPAPGTLSGPLRIQLGRDGNELSIHGEPTRVAMPAVIFIRVRPDSSSRQRTFVGRPIATGAEVRLRLPDSRYDSSMQLERLILPGT